MRRTLLVLCTTVLALSAVPALGAPAGGVVGPPTPSITSDNVTHVGYLPEEAPSVSGRVVKVGEQLRFYTSGFKGLSIYDVTEPASPRLLGRLSLPHSQNEDVDVSDDGSRVIISADGGFLLPLFLGTGIHVIDTSDPTNPRKVGFHASGHHTSSCADPACNIIYGSGGETFDLTDPTNPKTLTLGWQQVLERQGVRLTQGAHDFSRDATGLMLSDTIPRVLLDPGSDPARPTVVTTSGRQLKSSLQLAYQHNSTRPNAEAWTSRGEADTDPALRPGELMIANGETNLRPRCGGGSNGPIATWSMRDFDKGADMKPLEIFRPVANGTYTDGNPAVNALGCSGHYFDYRDDVLAAAWFEHGVRFIDVDPTTGKMEEIGFFQPINGSSGAAYWIDDEYVYVTDYARGIDILRFDRSADRPVADEIAASWLSGLDNAAATLSERERAYCSLAVR
jgi:hypothetical protein